MAAFLFGYEPRYRAISATGAPIPGAKLRFSVSPGTTPADSYATSDLTTANSDPVVADSGGLFPPIFLSSEVVYRVRLYTSADVLVWDQDGYSQSNDLTQSEFNAYYALTDDHKRTAAEIAAGVTPVNYVYAPADQANGDIRRFGAVGAVDITSILQNAINAISGHGIINIPYGTNYVTGTLALGGRIVEINLNRGALRVNGNISGHVFSCTTAGGKLILRNGTLDGNRATYTVNGNGVFCDGSALPEFYGFTVTGFTGSSGSDYPGTTVYTKKSCTGKAIIQDSYFNDSKGGAIILGDADSTSVWRDSGGKDNTDSTYGFGAIAGTRGGVHASGGDWENNVAGGFADYFSTATPGKHVRVSGMKFKGNPAFGRIIGQGGQLHTTLGCTFEDNGGTINADPLLNDTVTPADLLLAFMGNASDGGTAGFPAIRVNGAIGVLASGNVIKNPGSNGSLYALQSSDKVLADGNLLIGANSFVQVNDTANRVYVEGNLSLGLSGNPPYLQTATGRILQVGGTTYAGSYPAAPDGLWADIFSIDTSGVSVAPKLPVSTGDNKQLVTFFKPSSSNTMTITRSGSDVITKLDGTTANTEAFTAIVCVTYRAITGGWIRVQ